MESQTKDYIGDKCQLRVFKKNKLITQKLLTIDKDKNLYLNGVILVKVDSVKNISEWVIYKYTDKEDKFEEISSKVIKASE